MSALAPQTDRAVRELASGRERAARRARRAEAANVTEMARALLHEARAGSRRQAACSDRAAAARERPAAARHPFRRRGGASIPRLAPTAIAARPS